LQQNIFSDTSFSMPQSKTYLANATTLEPASLFPERISSHFASKIDFNHPNDPLLRQVKLLPEESSCFDNEKRDPVGDIPSTIMPGVIQKYSGRILLNVCSECPIHCRFCFRKNLLPTDFPDISGHHEEVLHYIGLTPSIHEVIFSGGDPLMADFSLLKQLVSSLAAMPHIFRIRVHSRVPVAHPQRIDQKMIALFSASRLPVIWVIHINHPNEIDPLCEELFLHLHRADIRLFSQTVLLKGVNDHPDVLQTLCERLFTHHVTPYYLHLLDPAAGTRHFSIPDQQAISIWQTLHARLPGYLLPRLVRELPGKPGKIHFCALAD
jgi:EF-P beta-lysylation protein EpmB